MGLTSVAYSNAMQCRIDTTTGAATKKKAEETGQQT
jgi:hypothetical protein